MVKIPQNIVTQPLKQFNRYQNNAVLHQANFNISKFELSSLKGI